MCNTFVFIIVLYIDRSVGLKISLKCKLVEWQVDFSTFLYIMWFSNTDVVVKSTKLVSKYTISCDLKVRIKLTTCKIK